MNNEVSMDRNYPYELASPQHRLGGKAVDIAMYLVTFGIGWFIWSLVVWGQGQTPGKQIVSLRVYDATTSKRVKWGHMALREFLVPLALTFVALPFVLVLSAIPNDYVSLFAIIFLYLSFFATQLVDAVWIFRQGKQQRLVDVFCKTTVLNETAPLTS